MKIIIIKNIEINKKITIKYNKNYFKKNNYEYLYKTYKNYN